jgi:hypothetical protein
MYKSFISESKTPAKLIRKQGPNKQTLTKLHTETGIIRRQHKDLNTDSYQFDILPASFITRH